MPEKASKASSRDDCTRPVTNTGGYGRLHESLVATRPVVSNRIKIHGATRVHAKHLATEEEKLPTTAKGNLASSSLKSRRRVVSSRAASSCAFPLVRFLTAAPSPRGCARTRRAGWLRNSLSLYYWQREQNKKARLRAQGATWASAVTPQRYISESLLLRNARVQRRATKDYERCNSAGTTAKRRGGPQRCRACSR